jgi:tetratricopeptide (TPR) repeat protein
MQLVSLAIADEDPARAEADLRRALLHAPDSPVLCNAMAWRLAAAADPARRNPNEALRYADKACKLTEGRPSPLYLDTLAVVYAQLGRFDDAVNIARQAVDLATKQGDTASAAEFETRLKLFEEKKPYIDKL